LPKNPLFIDTAYVYAIINPHDQWHEKAIEWQRQVVSENLSLVTTQFILAEIADGLAAVKFRRQAAQIIHTLEENSLIEVISASSKLFQAGFELYENRQDKDWGLTDCISFVVMTERSLTDALTVDEHFRQAGFRPLLLAN